MKKLLDNCTPEKKKKCIRGCGLENIEQVCATCPGSKPYEPSLWFNHIWFLYSLKEAGYPFGRNDLSIEEWMGIGEIKQEMEKMKTIGDTGSNGK